jgi:hypothetical protein
MQELIKSPKFETKIQIIDKSIQIRLLKKL